MEFLVVFSEEVPVKKSRFTDSQIIGVLERAEAGSAVPDLCREHGIRSATSYKWRSKFGGIDASMVSQMKALEEENRRLKDVRRSPAGDGAAEGGARKKMVRPSQRREMARSIVSRGRTSIRHACQLFSVSETCYRYQPRHADENVEIADWLVRLTTTYRTWGFGLCFLYLRNVKGFGWNHKRVYRIYRALGFSCFVSSAVTVFSSQGELLIFVAV